VPHGAQGQFNWQGVGQAAGQVAQTSTWATGPAVIASAQSAGWSVVGKEIGKAFGGELRIAGGLASLEVGLGRYAESVNESNRRLAPYSGALATAFHYLDFGEFQRNFQISRATAESATRLANNVGAGRDAWVPAEILAANINNRIGIFGAQLSRINGNAIGLLAAPLNGILEAIDPGGANSELAGRAAGVLQWGAAGAMIGGRLGGPWGAAAGGVAGLAVGFVADQQANQAPKEDPWGDFLKNANVMPRLPARPQNLVRP
jgi:hypothetical protein